MAQEALRGELQVLWPRPSMFLLVSAGARGAAALPECAGAFLGGTARRARPAHAGRPLPPPRLPHTRTWRRWEGVGLLAGWGPSPPSGLKRRQAAGNFLPGPAGSGRKCPPGAFPLHGPRRASSPVRGEAAAVGRRAQALEQASRGFPSRATH